MEDKELKVQDAKKDKAPKKDKKPFSLKKTITTIIIVALALLMIGSAYYIIILLTADKTEESNAYGSYDGENVLLEYNNVFYNTLMNDSSFQEAYTNGDYNTIWSSYYSAYQSQIMYIAISKLASEAGIIAPQDLVNKMILDSGVYNGEDGKFSADVYNSVDGQTRSNTESYIRTILPYQTVINDIYLTVTTANEKAFIVDLANDARDLEYFAIDYNAYPDYLARSYGYENADLFKTADVTTVTFSSQDAATSGKTLLDAGSDPSSIETATVGTTNTSVNEIQAVLSESTDIDKILALEVGKYSDPIANNGLYVVYRLDSEFKDADLFDEEVLSSVKAYIYKTDAESVKTYIDSAKDSAAELVKTDFAKASETYGNGIITVEGVADNVGGSQFASGLEALDSEGTLSAAADKDVSREIFTAKEGAVVGPVTVDGGYLFVKVASEDAESFVGSVIDSMYDYYAYQLPANDIANAIFTSDKLTDNFTTQFLSMMFSGMSTSN